MNGSEISIENIIHIEKTRWYDKQELERLGVYDECCFDRGNGILLKKEKSELRVLGGSAIAELKRKYDIPLNSSDHIEVVNLAKALGNPRVFEYVKKNPSLKVYKRIDKHKIELVPIMLLKYFKDIPLYEKKVSKKDKEEIKKSLPSISLNHFDMKYIYNHRYQAVEHIENILKIPAPIIEAVMYKMSFRELPSEEAIEKLVKIVEAIKESKGKDWNYSDIEKLRKEYAFKTNFELSRDLKRDVDDIEEEISSLGLGKINPNKAYTINEILKETGLGYSEINEGIKNEELEYQVVRRAKEEGGWKDKLDKGTFLVSGRSLIDFLRKKDKKPFVLSRREKYMMMISQENPDFSELGLEQRILQSPTVGVKKERELLEKINDGDLHAKDDLIEANYKLVFNYAKGFLRRYHCLDMWDLFQEGCIGLIDAAFQFNLDKKKTDNTSHKFSTYASWWIMQAISRAIVAKGQMVRKPAHIAGMTAKIAQISEVYIRNYGKDPTIKEIHDKLAQEKIYISRKKIKGLIGLSRHIVSLNKPVGEDEESEIQDFIADKSTSEDEFFRRLSESTSLIDFANRARSILSTKEERIFRLRTGLGSSHPMTLEEIGGMYQLTRERIRQLEYKAIKKLRKDYQIRKMFDINSKKST